MILPLLTYSSAVKTTYNRTQLTKLVSLERRASTNIGGETSVKSTRTVVEKQICTLFKRCLEKEIGHDVFDNYFSVLSRGKRTRNNIQLLNKAFHYYVGRPIKIVICKYRNPKFRKSCKKPKASHYYVGRYSRPSFYFGAAKIFNVKLDISEREFLK